MAKCFIHLLIFGLLRYVSLSIKRNKTGGNLFGRTPFVLPAIQTVIASWVLNVIISHGNRRRQRKSVLKNPNLETHFTVPCRSETEQMPIEQLIISST